MSIPDAQISNWIVCNSRLEEQKQAPEPIISRVESSCLNRATLWPPALIPSTDSLEDGTIFAQTDARNPPVQRVKLWQASSCDAHRMDWRQLSAKAEVCPCGQATSQGCENWVQWNSYDLPHHSFWRVRPNISADGRWTAFFLSFEWPGGIEISTEVSVVPTNFAFPDCGGDACGGMV
ncbi:unnamed protein product [Durusdinium trenchii]|uniref:Uncharacterized protein n=1 Tax=Durusdinium trenchii TaxID=1381693 RepID=A0ABP0MF63_9DINO